MNDVWLTIQWIDFDTRVCHGVFSDKEEAIHVLKEKLESVADGKMVDYHEMNPGYIMFVTGPIYLGQVVKMEVGKIIDVDV